MEQKPLTSFFNGFEKIITAIGSALLFIIVCLINLQVITRYFFRFQLSWSIEICSHLLLFALLLGASIAIRHASFASITLFIEKFPDRMKFCLSILNNVLTVIFSTACVIGCVEVAQKANLTKLLLPASHIPQSYIYIGVAVCFVLHVIFAVCNCVESYRFYHANGRMWKEGEI